MQGYHKHLRSNNLRDKLEIGKTYHKSVLPKEVLENLRVEKGKWYLDCTLGDGGYCLEILKLGGNIVGVDVDPQALKRAKARIEEAGFKEDRYRLVQGNFRELKSLVVQKFAGAIFDLGVSSLQLEEAERGFSFLKMGPLDMRMDPTLQVRALDLLNVLTRKELYELFKTLGEEKYSWSLAGALVRAREINPFTTTTELARIVERVVGGRKEKIPARLAKRSVAGRHPATQVFQALRIAVNDELGALEEGLKAVKDLIEKNGCIIVISFHSLEDRIVKLTFREWEEGSIGKILTNKPIVPTDGEINDNPRSRSAKMRIFEKL